MLELLSSEGKHLQNRAFLNVDDDDLVVTADGQSFRIGRKTRDRIKDATGNLTLGASFA